MKHEIIYVIPAENRTDVISFEQVRKRRQQRRRRVSKRMIKRFPLFAAEFMRDEFPSITPQDIIDDVTRKTRYKPKKRKGRSQLARQGRYPLMQKALRDYWLTKDEKHLKEAQRLRNNLFKRFIIEYRLSGDIKRWTFPSTTSVALIKQMAALKFKTWEELDAQLKELLRYSHAS